MRSQQRQLAIASSLTVAVVVIGGFVLRPTNESKVNVLIPAADSPSSQSTSTNQETTSSVASQVTSSSIGMETTVPSTAASISNNSRSTTSVGNQVERRIWNSTVGSVVVDVGNGLRLVDVITQAGFQSELKHDETDRVEVQFRSETYQSTIELRWDGTGVSVSIDNRSR